MSSTARKLEAYQIELNKAREEGQEAQIELYEDKVLELKRKLKKEETVIKPHPSLQFGPIAQTVAIMSALSLGLSVAPLPYQLLPFYHLFSRLTIFAVLCLVAHSSIIWYGYNQELAKLPKGETPEEKLAKMRKSKPDRPDLWAHSRSHPSAFLTTKHAPPRLFPFPLGKSRPEATVKDELWWEGGNAPHVGHFNKPKMAEPTGPDEETLMARVQASMGLEKQQKLWKRRIRTIQYLCVVIVTAFVNRNVAIAGLCWLIYSTFATELDNMLKPPPNMDEIYEHIDAIVLKSGKNESAPKPRPDQPVGGMGYIYAPTEAKNVKPNATIPIVTVPPHVLMTSENQYYAGPGEQIKDLGVTER